MALPVLPQLGRALQMLEIRFLTLIQLAWAEPLSVPRGPCWMSYRLALVLRAADHTQVTPFGGRGGSAFQVRKPGLAEAEPGN